MWTFALFGAKSFGYFEIYGVSARTRERGSIWRDFVRMPFMHVSLQKNHYPKTIDLIRSKSSGPSLSLMITLPLISNEMKNPNRKSEFQKSERKIQKIKSGFRIKWKIRTKIQISKIRTEKLENPIRILNENPNGNVFTPSPFSLAYKASNFT